MTGIGHNGGPTLDKGHAWRRYVWTRARAKLLPKLPLEVVRRRVRRAGELGIDYSSYAGIRATTGRDIVALLFSSNALNLIRQTQLDEARRARLEAILDAEIVALVHAPLDPAKVLNDNPILVRAGVAPGLWDGWRQTRDRILHIKGSIPGDGVVVIGSTALEKSWSEAGRLAGFIPAERYFA